MDKNNHQIVIAGGGIGGLASALCLARVGLSCHIVERSELGGEVGAGIQVGPNGTRILRELGVLDALVPFAGVPRALVIRNGGTGKVVTEFPLGDWICARHGSPYWVLHRVDLHRVLLDAAFDEPAISFEMNAAVADISLSNGDGDGVCVRTSQGETRFGQVVIGADGIWSRVREHVLDDTGFTVSPRFYGKSAARTVIPMSQVPSSISRDCVTLFMHRDAHLVCYPIREGSELAVVAVCRDDTARDQWGTSVEVDWVLDRLAGFEPGAREMVGTGDHWKVWGLHTFARLPTWVKGRVALLGDGAHPILPFLAQGAVMALEDAQVLASCLGEVCSSDGLLGGLGVDAALKKYQLERRSRVFRVQNHSLAQGRIYHMTGLEARGRDLALRVGSPKRFMAGFDWLYGWKA